MSCYDKIIIGGGIYGLYAALYCAKKGQKILVLEYDNACFKRATYINQARVHMGYHYPRSYSTAIKSAGYFQRFLDDYGFCVNSSFEKIYATSSEFSHTNGEEFLKFCKNANIPCQKIITDTIFNNNCVDAAYLCKEYTYDAQILLHYFLDELSKFHNIEIRTNSVINDVQQKNNSWELDVKNLGKVYSDYVLNATYASVNQILSKFNFASDFFKIKYELCEIILCDTNEFLGNKGITVMDGPFFSIMPFGKTGLHSLTAVSSTPHYTSFERMPKFKCQENSNGFCSEQQLGNCNDCIAKPQSAWPYMSTLAKKYLNNNLEFTYKKSLFSMKPILSAAEVDDSRPTVVKIFSEKPYFVSVLSGKINTVYDLDDYLDMNY